MQILKEEVKNNITYEAKKLFSEYGFEKTSMNMIAKEANVSKSNVYNYFATKEEIFYYITDAMANDLINMTEFFVNHKFYEKFGSNEFIEMMVQKLFKISSEHREELLLIMDCSKGTKYEDIKSKIINMLERHFAEGFSENIAKECFIAHVIAFNLIEGILEILRNKKDNREIYDNFNKLIKYHIKGSEMLINK
ncbi:TetR/AcrR family transcriptional regulator [Clostridium aquiflavi]|uniref:TetR/AcrR family transcriptional regulator n=1 Tax=Clostridium aquiflavi TaxID=3073603 RepID=A0ABU1EHP3_9CLOT|nr:TetR/AcrR family transcriptional regulator [Clostridium sp. 5N-1]MDR5587911.1 TetR/AcrR family transcriptional regulator [Clostridium sp. 5N-1]